MESDRNVRNIDVDYIDPDPMAIILEIANLVTQPGSLSLVAQAVIATGSMTTATIALLNYADLSNKKKSSIRGSLYAIDRALTKGFSGLMILGSLLDQYSYLDMRKRIGGAPIPGFKNTEMIRRTHEDCRAAVKEARDAFIELSRLLPRDDARFAHEAINRLNELAEPILSFNQTYGVFLVAAAMAIQEVDKLICNIGYKYGFNREPRDFSSEIRRSLPSLRELNINL